MLMSQPLHDKDLFEHTLLLRRLARALVNDEHVAEDLAQEAMVAGLERPPQHPASITAWLIRVVRTRAFDVLRSNASRTRHEQGFISQPAMEGPDEISMRIELQRRVLDLLAQLPEIYRTAVYLRFQEGLTPKQIAARTGAPIANGWMREQEEVAAAGARLSCRWQRLRGPASQWPDG